VTIVFRFVSFAPGSYAGLREVTRAARIALLEMRRHLDFGQVLPLRSLCQQLPTLVGIVCCMLAAQRTHSAVVLYVFHFATSLDLSLRLVRAQRHYIGVAVS
jgi:hypothetical protein